MLKKENLSGNSDFRLPTSDFKHPVLFVGAGPGDPELITVKGQRALKAADMVIYAGS
ncbi:MAG: SAM-dependent methyltransferase, partial [Desulfobacterales bacterium]